MLEKLFSISNVLYTLLLAFCIFIIHKAIKIYFINKRLKNVPGRECNNIFEFFVGDLVPLIKANMNGICYADYFTTQVQKYGKTCKMRVFDDAFVITADPEIVKLALIDEDFVKDPIIYQNFGFPIGDRFVGNGVLSETDHKKWRLKRAFLNPGFHKTVLRSFLKEFNVRSDILVNYLKKFADGKTKITMLEEFNRTAMDIIANVAFSMNLDSINDRSNRLNEVINSVFEIFDKISNDPFYKFLPQNWIKILKFKKDLKSLRKIGYDEIFKRLQAFKDGADIPNDILSVILRANENEVVNIDEMVDDFVTFFIAGQETTSATLAFALRELCRNPNVLDNLRKEVDAVLGSRTEMEYKDLAELKYTSAVIKETLRIYPPVPSLARFTNKEIRTEKFVIPSETVLVPVTYVSSRDEEYFPEPLKFKPERFLHDQANTANTRKNYSYYPFSLGTRTCIGQNFAQMEAKVILAKLIQKFNFELDPNESFEVTLPVTLHPKDGTKCYLKLRS